MSFRSFFGKTRPTPSLFARLFEVMISIIINIEERVEVTNFNAYQSRNREFFKRKDKIDKL